MPSGHQTKNTSRRLFSFEGGVHFYSSPPIALTPAELHWAKSHKGMKVLLQDCNIYLIVTRRRIFLDPEHFDIEDGNLHGSFVVQRHHAGPTRVEFSWPISKDALAAPDFRLEVAESGTHLDIFADGGYSHVAPHTVIATAKSSLRPEDCDLEVIYVGQGIGRSSNRSALDRLTDHSTLQQILADMVTYHPNCEVLLLLYRFEHGKTFLSTGGDLTAEPLSSPEEDHVHFERISNVELSRREKVALVEAALIKHFQPVCNFQLKGSDFSARNRIKILQELLRKDISGLMVEICSSNIRSRLMSPSAAPLDLRDIFEPEVLNGSRLTTKEDKLKWAQELFDMAHSHFSNHPLTTPDERDTFMHGTLWHGETERVGFKSSNAPRF